MAQKTKKKVTRKRQSKKLPLLGFKKKPAKKPRATKRRKQQGLRIRLGRSLYLEIQIKHTKKRRAKRGRPSKKELRQRQFRKAFAATLITVGLAGIIYFGLNLALAPKPTEAFFTPPVPQASSTDVAKPTDSSIRPSTLVIPDINVATTFVTIGRQADGTMEVPKRFDVGGWYKYSPVPGEFGPAVIVGHVDSTEGPAVFWRLRELRPGQLIVIKRSDSKTVRFKVTSVEQFDQDKFPTEKVYGDIDYAGIRLITCGGWFDRSIQRYSHNTVVFATLVV